MLRWSTPLRILNHQGLLSLNGTYSGALLSCQKRIMPLRPKSGTPSMISSAKASPEALSMDYESRTTLPGGERELGSLIFVHNPG